MGKSCDIVTELKPVLLMVVVQVVFAGVNVFGKLAIDDGMSIKVMTAYRFIFAAIFMIPPALIFERNSRPKLTWTVLFQACLCGLFSGSLTQNIYMESLFLTSATFASAMCNLMPAVIFILATCLGMEKLGLRTAAGKAKVAGTLMCVGGAMMLTFYKGPQINIWSTHVDLLKHRDAGHVAASHGNINGKNLNHDDVPKFYSTINALGSILAVASCFGYASYLIALAKMAAAYPCPYSCTALMSIMAAVQAVAYALCAEKDWGQWRLGFDIRLLAVAYLGISICVIVALSTWCVRARGPVFVSAFNPLTSVLVALAGSLVLEEMLHLGSILGATSIVCGLYTVLWGKSKDMKKMSPPTSVSTQEGAELIGITATTPPTTTDGDFMSKELHGNT